MPAPALVHRGVAYDDDAELARAIAPVLARAVAAGEQVGVAIADATGDALRDLLGAGAGEVEFLDNSRTTRHDAFQVAARRAGIVAQAAAAGTRTFVVTQDQPGLGRPDAYWLRLEAAFATALADLPVTLLCAYRRLAGGPGPGYLAVHAETVAAAALDDPEPNPECRAPADVVAGLPGVVVDRPPSGARRHDLDRSSPARLRRRLEDDLAAAGLDGAAHQDLVYAASEVATNAVEHGGGTGRAWTWADGDDVVCLVANPARLADPFPGVVPPPTAQDRGRGLWLARALCDDVDVAVDDDGTRVRLARRRERTEPTARQTR